MRQALEDMIEVVEAAISAGDWKVDGACEPTLALIRAKKALEQTKQCEYPRCACDNKESCKQKAQPEKEPDWKGLVLSHNADCESRCDMERCKYAPYFKANGRRCPTCPVYEIIDVDYTPTQRTWVGLTEDELPPLAGDNGKYMELQQVRRFYKYIEAKLKKKNGYAEEKNT